ncbi:LRR receptor-like serine/threonine-protein kinase EFR [Tasmannia lanceolata]|uniref:LRR receptor-like serine/threonine-protein kinase EFR n=1 Tax=Tasmannia lanceolata TaxID=3420 RepID=UPI0040635B8B
MELPGMGLCVLCLFILSTNLIFFMNVLPSESASLLGNETDRIALLTFKDGISSDPLRALSSWNHTLHFCHWEGVTCGRRHQRVTVLDLSRNKLGGSISPAISNLTFLEEINLQENSFKGQIPQEIGRLFRLRYLNMSNNFLEGEILTNLTRCTHLRFIDLYNNNLTGKIPVELSTLSKLLQLNLGKNDLTGRIPPPLGNLSSLTDISLLRNHLKGSIPDEIARIESLQYFVVSSNELSGRVPSSLYNHSSIVEIVLTGNQLYGSFPLDVGLTLPSLQALFLGGNRFTGHFPKSMSNASQLEKLGLSSNYFHGPVSENLGSLKNLIVLGMTDNHLGTGKYDDLNFITSLTNCSYLNLLALNLNHFGGALPSSIVNLSTELHDLVLDRNQIFGSIPSQIGNLFNLQLLSIYETMVTGIIPTSIGKLQSMQQLDLSVNSLSGQIPSSIGNLSGLLYLFLQENHLEGTIPVNLRNCHSLLQLSFAQNNLHGTIPKQFISISSLSIGLNLSLNFFTGSLPLEVGSLTNLGVLDISWNKLSGEIPSTLGNCKSLLLLSMQGNSFQGTIDPFLNTLTAIQLLDLSSNNFSGKIPKYLEKFQFLQYINLSFNSLEGEVPKEGIFRNASSISVIGNHNLCGGIPKLKLPACSILANEKRGKSFVSRVIIPIISSVLCLVSILCVIAALYWTRKSRKKPSSTFSKDGQHLQVSYSELFKATNGFSSANLIGVGSYGSVYKGILGQDENVVAVKVLNLQLRGASKSFMDECEALRNVRHRNLIKIITSCSSIDFGGNDFKALVFEFMPNGSLEKWLHPKADGQHQLRSLNFSKRLNIAIDIASALEYLHHHCHIPITHCDLKPSNILLDEDMNAHLGDFGLARFLSRIIGNSSEDRSSTIALKGTIGYIAPEYATGGHVSMAGDVYSYGILLLEIFIGKSPTGDMFKDGLSLRKFAELGFPEQVMDIVDPLLLEDEEVRATSNIGNDRDKKRQLLECLVSLVRIGIACSAESPRERMEMGDVAKEMNVIRKRYLGVGIHTEIN